MKSLLYACASISLYLSSSVAMEKEKDEKKKRDTLPQNLFVTVKKDKKKSSFLDKHDSPTKRLLDAIRSNKNADFIQFLIERGADVNLETENGNYCLPIALTALFGDPKTVAAIIKGGGLSTIINDKEGHRGASLVIRFIREAEQDNKNAWPNYISCLQHLIKAGCAVQQKKVGTLSRMAYINLSGLPMILYDFASDYSDEFTTPLIEAVRLNMPTFAKLLIQAGADPDKKYNDKSARDIAQKKSIPQRMISWFTSKEEKDTKKNIIDLAINEIESDRIKAFEKVWEEERLKQQEIEFKEKKRTCAIPRLAIYLTLDKNYVELKTILELNRT